VSRKINKTKYKKVLGYQKDPE